MNNNVPQIFNFKSAQVRVQIDDQNNPWFNVNDVCKTLGLGNPRQAVDSHVDKDDVQKMDIISTYGNNGATRKQLESYVNESGLYALIFGSKKQEAKEFKRWVTSEVLPTIRKTGSYNYIEGRRVPTNFIEALEELIVSEGIIKELKSKIEEDAPKVELCDNLLLCEETDISLSETAKLLNNYGIDIGRNRLIALLKEWGWYTKKTNEPSQKYISNGYFKVKQKYVYGLGKHVCVGRLTPKGEMALVKKLQKKSRKDCLGSMQGKLILSDDFNDC